MKYLSTLTFVLITLLHYSQSADKGVVNFNLGSGANYNIIQSNIRPNNKGQSLALQHRFAISYNTHKRVTLGLELVSNSFLTDDSTRFQSIKSGMLGVNFEMSLTNREKSRLFVGATIGGFNLDFDVLDSLDNNGVLKGKGAYNKIYLGYNKYFGKHFGFYIHSGFMNMPVRMESLTINGESKDYFDNKLVTDWKLLMRGGYLNLGLAIKI